MTAAARLRILVVDDDANSRDSLSLLLADEGHAVDACRSGTVALARLATSTYDVLLTDLMMPGLSGLELVHAARTSAPAMRCFIMSGHAPSAEAADIAWLAKPIDIEGLLAALAG
jgi:CheY-like chemotaxis protein